MRLRTALMEHRRRRDERFPAERPTVDGAFSGDAGRLVYIAPDGAIHDCSYPLSGVGGIDQCRFGLAASGSVRWFADLDRTRQHYDGDTPLVETEYDAGRYTVHQFDLTVDDVHLTHVELRGSPPADGELVAACAFAPDMVEGQVGNLIHEGAGPKGGSVVEAFHRHEHDFLTASTGLSAARGTRQEQIADLLGENGETLPRRGEIDAHEDSHLTADVVVHAPFERDGRKERVTLASRAVRDDAASYGVNTDAASRGRYADTDADDSSDALREANVSSDDLRADRLTAIADAASSHPAAADLRAAAAERAQPVPDGAPRPRQLAADLRTLDLLRAPSGARIAGPEYDPFYATSGGYGYTWFRDDAEVANALLSASSELDLPVRSELLDTADFLCRTQDADGGWPHRVWADSGAVAPGWANARIEGARTEPGPDDQLDQPATVVAFLARLRRTTDLDPDRRQRVDDTIEEGLSFLCSTTDDDGLPICCQNCWENASGRFTHTGARYLQAFATVARAPVDDAVRERAAVAADAAAAGLADRWLPNADRFPQRADGDDVDPRADASTFALVGAVTEYVALRENNAPDDTTTDAVDIDEFLDRVATHVRTSIDALRRETHAIEGLVRFVGDDWRTAEQGSAKVWSVSTLLGAQAAAELAGFLANRDEDVEDLFAHARNLYQCCEQGGSLSNDAGLLAEQVFDDGDLDSATPLGWSHALRVTTTVTLARHGALPVPHERTTTPESAPQWTTGRKFGLGTPADYDTSDPVPVWFTLTEGALTEPRFPRIDVMNLRTLDFLITDPETAYTIRTFDETSHLTTTETITRTTEPIVDDALAYRQTIRETGDGHGHEWTLTVEYAVDTDGNAIVADVSFSGGREYDVYAVADTTITNVGTDDYGLRVGSDGFHLLARNKRSDRPAGKLVDDSGAPFDVAVALSCGGGFDWASADHTDSDSLDALFGAGTRDETTASTEATGNVVLTGLVGSGRTVSETIALGFAKHADTAAALGEAEGALSRGFEAIQTAYIATWRSWLEGRTLPASVTGNEDLETQYRFAVMTLAAVEDKQHPGAGIASPSVPWGETEHAAEDRGYGYNFVWSRDLYQVFTALVEIGEIDRAVDALAYLYETQQDEAGFLPQNTYIDGRTRWGGEQMDNIAYPAVMAWELAQRGVAIAEAAYSFEQVRRSVSYVATNGPTTAQERWEEESGYSPSSIAAEIAGLVCAADLALSEASRLAADGGNPASMTDRATGTRVGDGSRSAADGVDGETLAPDSLHADAIAWLALADEWTTRVESWCATETGTERHAETPYYLRITADGDPESGRPRTIANDGPTYDEREIVDGGFLELVRLGIKPADDPIVQNSVAVVDDSIRVDTPYGPGWYRYVGDAYGELQRGDPGAPWAGTGGGKGRLWPIFTGERAEYELRARSDGDDAFGGTDEPGLEPAALLETMAGFGNTGRMLPEQVWDREHPTPYGWSFGEGTGGATPLAWSMAGFIRLAHGIDAGDPVETPAVVRSRYVESDRPTGPSLVAGVDYAGDKLVVSGRTEGRQVAVHTIDGSRLVKPDEDGRYSVSLDADTDADVVVVAAIGEGDIPDAGTTVERVRI